jgi:hypothetical protein
MSEVRRRGVVFALVCVLAAFAGAAYANHAWSTYHWSYSGNPLTLSITDNVTSAWDAFLVEANSDWNVSTRLNNNVVAGSTTTSVRRRCRPTAGRVNVCNYTYGNNGWLGVAQIWLSGGHIAQGTTKLNDTYFNQSQYNSPAWRRLVTCQEVGHDFGLGHQDEGFSAPNLGSCMDYTNDPDGGGAYGPSNEHPNSHDYAQLEAMYNHVGMSVPGAAFDAARAVREMPPAMRELDLAGPGQWGRLVKRSGEGHQETYVADFGRGWRVVTHVFWAPGRRGGHGH